MNFSNQVHKYKLDLNYKVLSRNILIYNHLKIILNFYSDKVMIKQYYKKVKKYPKKIILLNNLMI